MAALWIAFFVGAACGAYANKGVGPYLMVPPAAVLFVLCMVDLCRPIAASDEHVRPRR